MRSHFTHSKEVREGIHLIVCVTNDQESENLVAALRKKVLQLSDRYEFFMSFKVTKEPIHMLYHFDGRLTSRVDGTDELLDSFEEFLEKNVTGN